MLAPLPLALEVPAFTGRAVWAGHEIWTPDPTGPAQVGAFYTGAMPGPQAEAFVTRTGVRWVLAQCTAANVVVALLTPLTAEVRHFGCVAVIRLK